MADIIRLPIKNRRKPNAIKRFVCLPATKAIIHKGKFVVGTSVVVRSARILRDHNILAIKDNKIQLNNLNWYQRAELITSKDYDLIED